MKEAQVREALGAFNVREYVEASRLNGRAEMDKSVQAQAVGLYEMIRSFRSNETFVSRKLDAVLDLAERVLFSDWFFSNNPVPRYPAYTNVHVLNWVLGTNQRQPYNRVWLRCWTAISFLIHDLISFEAHSLAEIIPWQRSHIDRVAVAERIQKLHILQASVKKKAPRMSMVSIDIPEDWNDYIMDSKVAALLHLTALPQTTEHDEYLFLRTIHISECCFWGLLTSVIASMEQVKIGNLASAIQFLGEAVAFAEILVPLFQAFKTMSPERFTNFRDATGNASAIQSRTYQMMQIFTQGMDDRKAAIIQGIPEVADLLLYDHPSFVDLRSLLKRMSGPSNLKFAKFSHMAVELDKALYAWRCIHIGIAREYLPITVDVGTGGTSGAPYLAMHFRRRIFPTDGFFVHPSVNHAQAQFLVPVLSRLN